MTETGAGAGSSGTGGDGRSDGSSAFLFLPFSSSAFFSFFMLIKLSLSSFLSLVYLLAPSSLLPPFSQEIFVCPPWTGDQSWWILLTFLFVHCLGGFLGFFSCRGGGNISPPTRPGPRPATCGSITPPNIRRRRGTSPSL